MSNQLGFPKKCQDKANELVNAHGYDKTLEILDERIEAKTKEHALVDIRTDTQLKINLACEVDFLSQTKQAIKLNK
jgi:hypothetical protein